MYALSRFRYWILKFVNSSGVGSFSLRVLLSIIYIYINASNILGIKEMNFQSIMNKNAPI